MVIRGTDTVRELLRRDEGLIEVLAPLSPTLEKLRNPSMRKVMAGLLTVEQVAQMAGLEPDALLARLNGDAGHQTRDGHGAAAAATPEGSAQPSALAAIPEAKVRQLDVRDELRAGREPFSLIMAARREVPEGGALCLRAIFEPVPLYAVMASQGFAHHSERLAEDDWRVWFYPADAGQRAAPATSAPPADRVPGGAETEPAADVVFLDVRGLEPPEPMVRTLEALETLPDGRTLVQINSRIPRFLLPQLDERGFTYEVREQSRDLVRVFIRRAAAQAPGNPTPPITESNMSATKTLDVRIIPPREKHPTIFQTFAALGPGEAFILLNDHDPLPLRYQFEYEHKDQFRWTYLEEGPQVWRVEIGKPASS
ncbi:MAG: DUF2249 domain-containing protein [Candidatus Eisenbacteria bacterium]|nr:DUF2249 domain-containing protein [Candidatus Eisenbacteria bacterium]